MQKPRIYITRSLPPKVLDTFQGRADVEMHDDSHVLTKEELIAKLKDRDAVIVVGTPIDEEVCKAIAPTCKILTAYGIGFNHIDVDAATRNGIYVSNTPDAVTVATADHTMALLLACARRIVESDHFVRAGEGVWTQTHMLATEVSGKTLGVIGGGRIGKAVAKRAVAFDMPILYTDVAPNAEFEALCGGTFVDRTRLLKEADFVTVHVPLMPETRHLIGADELKLMKSDAILINAARGPIVDEKALVEALRNGVIRGAGLDVFENEPAVEPGLLDLPNAVLTPHIGTQTLETRVAVGETCAANIFAVLDGSVPPNCLNPEVAKAV